MPDTSSTPKTEDVLAKLEAAIKNNEPLIESKSFYDTIVERQTLEQVHHIDQSPDIVDAAKQRANNLVQGICNEAQLSMKARRDELDNHIARIETSKRALAHYIGEFAALSAESMRISQDIKSLIEQAASPFAANPPSTITQLKNGKE